jgi:hypothetical protein
MKSFLLTLFVVCLGCNVQAHGGGGSGHGGGGSYSHGGYYRSYGAGFYAPSGYGYGYDDGFGYDYPFYYDGGSVEYDASPYPSSAVSPASVPPSACVPATSVSSTAPATTTPVPASPSLPAKKPALNQIPFGFDIGTKLIKSPWSSFVINGAGKPPEQVVYDANTGQAFRIPPP